MYTASKRHVDSALKYPLPCKSLAALGEVTDILKVFSYYVLQHTGNV